MPIQNGSYVSPTWVDDAPPAMDAAEMQAITDTLVANQSQGATASEQALAAFATDTASGSIATFTDGADGIPVKSLVAQIEPVQEGSGDPSPTNIRPITGWTGATVSVGAVSGTADATYTVTWTSEVFAGTATYMGGGQWSIQATHIAVNLEGLVWSYTAAGSFFNVGVGWLHLDGSKRDTLICNKYKTLTPAASVLDDNCIGLTLGGDSLRIRDSRYTDPATFKATLSDAVCYAPLLEAYYPAPVIVDGPDPATLLGNNNIWADTGDVSVVYRADTGLYIAKKIAEVTA